MDRAGVRAYVAAMRRYWELSRTRTYAFLFAAPLLLLYEAGAAALATHGGAGLRNGADVLLRTLLAAGGVTGTAGLTIALLVIAAVGIAAEQRRRTVRLRPGVFAGMLAESAALALVFGTGVGVATQWVLGPAASRLAADGVGMGGVGLADGVVLSLGAGVYEELVFRVLLVGGLVAGFRLLRAPRSVAAPAGAVLAALAFSAFHYVGPYADAWALGSFTFRFLAGLAFSTLFLLRGFGIAAWTHALYDVFLLLGRGW